MARSKITFTGARVVDPASGRDEIADVVIEGETIAAVGDGSAGVRIDATGLVIAPGLVDLHVHLREPGGEAAETVQSGTAAAALGGFTAVCPMANTDPVTDHAGVVEQVMRLAREAGYCDVFPVGAITRNLEGEELAELGDMVAAGVRCFSDDGRPVRNAQVMRRALEYARTWDAIICNHAEEAALTAGAQMNESELSSVLGLAGWPREAEEIQVARDLILARGLGTRVHIPHVSTAETVDLIRSAKAAGVRVTAEATPHHFSLTEELVASYDPVFKVNPPLRTKADVEAVREGLADGTIDAIATDHAPHPPEEKERPFDQAPPGMLGLEYALALAFTQLVDGGTGMTEADVIARMSWQPAAIAGLTHHGGPIAPGATANLCVIDPQERWTIDDSGGASRSRNVPYVGREVRGRVRHTLLFGESVVADGEAQR